jgi:membrane protein implicated in regulation of membrane protease activity
MDPKRTASPAGPVLVAAMAVAVLAGAPLVYLIWDAVNQLLTGNVAEISALPALVATLVFAVLLWVLGRSVMRVMGHDDHRAPPVSDREAP